MKTTARTVYVNLALRWIKVDRDQSKIIIKYKTILQGLVRQRVQGRNYDISAGQHQPSSGLLRKTRIYMVFMFSLLTGNDMKRLSDV